MIPVFKIIIDANETGGLRLIGQKYFILTESKNQHKIKNYRNMRMNKFD